MNWMYYGMQKKWSLCLSKPISDQIKTSSYLYSYDRKCLYSCDQRLYIPLLHCYKFPFLTLVQLLYLFPSPLCFVSTNSKFFFFFFFNSIPVIISLYFYEVPLSHEKSVNRRREEHLRERAHRGGICVLHCALEKRLSRAPTAQPILLSP
jgi:hypothetical protein